MINSRSKLFLIVALTMLAMPCFGQHVEFVDGANKRFLTKAPKIGATLENVQAFSDDGNEFRLGSTRGKHTVLIFGCLT